MRTARLLPVSLSMHCSGGEYLPGGYLPGGWGVYLCGVGVPAQGVYLPGGVPAQEGCTCLGGYMPRRGVPTRGYLSGGCTCPEDGDTCPGTPPPTIVNRIAGAKI